MSPDCSGCNIGELRGEIDRLSDDLEAMQDQAVQRTAQLANLAGQVAQLELGQAAQTAHLTQLAGEVSDLKAAQAAQTAQVSLVLEEIRGLRSDFRADLRAERRQTLIVVVVALALVAGIALGTAQIDLLGVGVSVGQ